MIIVTPSRVCELKLGYELSTYDTVSHTLTGVWVETANIKLLTVSLCHTLTGVWVETEAKWLWKKKKRSHPHGCVSWNFSKISPETKSMMSHPHGCVSWNPVVLNVSAFDVSHTLTGVWVETQNLDNFAASSLTVTPSRVCELKPASL